MLRALATLLFVVPVLVSVLIPVPAQARPGDLVEPLWLSEGPVVHTTSTAGRAAEIQRSACRPERSLAGGELAYRISLLEPTLLRAELSHLPDDDLDLLLLADDRLDASDTAQHCLAHGDRALEQLLPAGEVLLVVVGVVTPAAFQLRVDLEALGHWVERPIAKGVALRTRRAFDAEHGPSFEALLEVDLSEPGVRLQVVDGTGCATTSALGKKAGAVAAINGGFFAGPRCRSTTFLKTEGTLRYPNRKPRSALGLDAHGQPRFATVPAGQGWPEVEQALGGVPRLLRAGQLDVAWQKEKAREDFALQRHPRSAVASTADGKLLLYTVDGRTPAGAGQTLEETARALQVLGAHDALTLDGGGSTTLWVKGELARGVVNHPSDNERADHEGQRLVGSALVVHAEPLEPRNLN